MKIQGEHHFSFPPSVVWEALMDPEVLSRTLPGCEQLTQVDDDTLEGRLQVAIGPVRGQFRGTLTMTDRDAPNGYAMCLDGRGPSGFMKGEGSVALEPDGSGTLLRYDLEAQVGGRIAGVGQRLLDSSSKVIAAQGLAGLECQLAARQLAAQGEVSGETSGETRSAPAVDLPAPPSQAALAVAVASGVARDLIPPGVRLALTIAVAFLLGLALGVWLGGGA
ncbi:MAG: carbon monoxide dehydrogenase subunit G [Thermoanaerobaculia bacterium]|nr:carbon monoxide dehydrogenase subunit G [Thermoanaerobaculia bacterium]